MPQNFINMIGILFELYIPNVLFKKTGEKIKSIVLYWVLTFVAFLIQILNNYVFLSKSQYVMIISLFSVLVLSARFNMEIKTRIYSCVFIFVIGVLSEFIIAYISTMIFNVDTKHTQSNPYLLLICTLSSKFLHYSILRVIKISKNTKHFPFSLYYNILPLPLASLPVLLLLFDCCYRIPEKSLQIIALISSAFLILANIFVFNLIEKHTDYLSTKNQLNFTKRHIDYQIQHYKELYQYQYEIRKYQHDTKNRLIGLLALLEDKSYEDAILAVKKELDLINDNTNNVVNSNNPILDAVLLSKIKTASNYQIKIEPKITIGEPLNVDAIDLSILIGNAIDNAIEASQQVSSIILNPTIKIKILSLVEQISIEITNPVKENVNTSKLKSNKNNKYFHGLGIQSMRSIVSKYNGEIFFSCQDYQFNVNIILANIRI